MRARDVVGKRIVAVEHARFYNRHLEQLETVVEAVILEDGTRLIPNASIEVEGGCVGDLLVRKPRKAVAS